MQEGDQLAAFAWSGMDPGSALGHSATRRAGAHTAPAHHHRHRARGAGGTKGRSGDHAQSIARFSGSQRSACRTGTSSARARSRNRYPGRRAGARSKGRKPCGRWRPRRRQRGRYRSVSEAVADCGYGSGAASHRQRARSNAWSPPYAAQDEHPPVPWRRRMGV